MNEMTQKIKPELNGKPYPFKHGSQCDRILQYLLSGKSLNNWEIREKFMCLSHTARISELRKHGYMVVAEQISDGVWQYRIPRIFIQRYKKQIKQQKQLVKKLVKQYKKEMAGMQ